jgi:hypothetical protein
VAAIYQEIEIEWEGKAYKVRPSYKLVQRLEQSISISSLSWRCDNGEAPLSQLCDLLSMVLRAAGCKDDSADAEEIYLSILHDPEHTARLITMGREALRAFFPQRKLPGNAKAPAKAAGANRPTSTGQSTTESQSDTSESSPPSSGG